MFVLCARPAWYDEFLPTQRADMLQSCRKERISLSLPVFNLMRIVSCLPGLAASFSIEI